MTRLLPCLFLLIVLATGVSADDDAGFQLLDTDVALLVIDIQEFYFPDGAVPLVEPEPAAARAAELIAAFRAAGRPVVHVGHRSSVGEAFHADVTPAEGESVVMKDEVCAFVGTDLQEVLQAARVDHLVIVGMQTHMCLEGAVRAAHDLGYVCTVVADACATRDLAHDETTVPAAQVHAATLATLDGAYARVIDAETFLAEAVTPFDPIRFRHEELADHLVFLRGAGGNMLACRGPEGLLLVDSDYQEMRRRLAAQVDTLGGRAKLVVNTHWHYDHVGGNEMLANAGAEILAHANVQGYMTGDLYLDVLHGESPAWPEAAWPTRDIAEFTTLSWGDETVELTPAAGHTGGDLIVRFRNADVVHVGDNVFSGGYPYIDTRHGGSIDGMIAALTAATELCGPETTIIPGHGPPLDLEGLRTYVAMLSEYRDAVAAKMDEGLDLAALQAARPAAHLDETWGPNMMPPDLFIEEIWISLGGEPSPPPAED